ncbi:hypothetical protein D3C87_1842670 [compost metagenome]
MNSHHPPNDLTPDQQHAARDSRWANTTSTDWHAYLQPAEAAARPGTQTLERATKPTRIPSQSPGDPTI